MLLIKGTVHRLWISVKPSEGSLVLNEKSPPTYCYKLIKRVEILHTRQNLSSLGPKIVPVDLDIPPEQKQGSNSATQQVLAVSPRYSQVDPGIASGDRILTASVGVTRMSRSCCPLFPIADASVWCDRSLGHIMLTCKLDTSSYHPKPNCNIAAKPTKHTWTPSVPTYLPRSPSLTFTITSTSATVWSSIPLDDQHQRASLPRAIYVSMMRAARYYGKEDIRVEQIPSPSIKPGQVKVRQEKIDLQTSPDPS